MSNMMSVRTEPSSKRPMTDNGEISMDICPFELATAARNQEGRQQKRQRSDYPLWLDRLRSQFLNHYATMVKKLAQKSTALRALEGKSEVDNPLLKISFSLQLQNDDGFKETLGELRREFQELLRRRLVLFKENQLIPLVSGVNPDKFRNRFLEDAQKTLASVASPLSSTYNVINTYIMDIYEELPVDCANIKALIERETGKKVRSGSYDISHILSFSVSNSCTSIGSTSQRHSTGRAEAKAYAEAKTLCKATKKGAKHEEEGSETKISVSEANEQEKVNNLSSIDIPDYVINFLKLGCKYTPSLKINNDYFRLTWELHKKKILSICEKTARISLKNSLSPLLDIHDYSLYRELSNLNSTDTLASRTSNHIRPIKDFMINNKLIIKQADKNLGPTIMDYSWYNNQVMMHLNNKAAYTISDFPETKILSELKEIFSKYHINDAEKFSLYPKSWVLPEFYVIPKLHKNPVSTRPIVPNFNSITTLCAKWLHQQLWPVVRHYQWVLPGTLSAVKQLSSQHFYSKIRLVSADIESLYTNIELESGIRKVTVLLRKNNVPRCDFVIAILRWVLCNNYFQYNGITYKQICGTAMGSNVAPAFANLYLIFHELSLKSPKYDKFPSFYLRYIDDVFFVWEHSLADLLVFQNSLESTSGLKYNFTSDTSSVIFLDLRIFKGFSFRTHNTLDWKSYNKPTDSFLYTHPSTYVPRNYKFSWITGENIRLLRNNSSEATYHEAIEKFKENLLIRGYTNDIYNEYCKYSWIDRPRLLLERIKPPNSSRIVIKHQPGYHLLKKYDRLIRDTINRSEWAPLLQTQTCIGKGTIINDLINSFNKSLISISSHNDNLSDNTGLTLNPVT